MKRTSVYRSEGKQIFESQGPALRAGFIFLLVAMTTAMDSESVNKAPCLDWSRRRGLELEARTESHVVVRGRVLLEQTYQNIFPIRWRQRCLSRYPETLRWHNVGRNFQLEQGFSEAHSNPQQLVISTRILATWKAKVPPIPLWIHTNHFSLLIGRRAAVWIIWGSSVSLEVHQIEINLILT